MRERTERSSEISIGPLRVATPDRFDLGEGPFWDPIREQLLWVDIRVGQVLVGHLLPSGQIVVDRTVSVPGTVGAVAVSESGEWVLAGTHGLLFLHPDGTMTDGPRLLEPDSNRRLNDGKPDPAGRYVVGTLSLTSPSDAELLAVIDHDGMVSPLDEDLSLANGLAWTEDGATMYSIDTVRGVVFRRSYDVATGIAGPRSVLITISDGSPDGMCLDAEGRLWIAIWGAGEVRCYSPDGTFVAAIEVPSPHVSSVAFAGRLLQTLVITSATQDMTADQLAAYPLAGHVFTAEVGVCGALQPLWAGGSTTALIEMGSTI